MSDNGLTFGTWFVGQKGQSATIILRVGTYHFP